MKLFSILLSVGLFAFFAGCASTPEQAAHEGACETCGNCEACASGACEACGEEGACCAGTCEHCPTCAIESAEAQAPDAVVMASGLSCPLCANSLTLLLEDEPGIEPLGIDLNTGEIRLALDGSVEYTEGDLAKLVDAAGFTFESATFLNP